MKKFGAIFAILLAILVLISGCLGGGGEKTSTSSAGTGGYTNGEGTSSGDYTTTIAGGTEVGTTTETQTDTGTWEYASWADPWDAYNPISIDGGSYLITSLKYRLRVRKEEGGSIYEYEVEKRRGDAKIHVYGMKINMETGEQEKTDLGEFDVYEYSGKITSVNSENMTEPFEYKLWVKERTEDTDTFFLFPSLDFLTIYASLYGGSDNVVGIWMKYGNEEFEFYNPGAVGNMSVTPYQEGNMNSMVNVGDIQDIYMGWWSFQTFGFWGVLEDENIYQATQGSWGAMGYQYNYEINPDGKVTLGGHDFKVSTVKWTYKIGDVTGQGEATLAANLPVPIEAKGVFIAQGTNIFTHIKLEDIGFEKV